MCGDGGDERESPVADAILIELLEKFVFITRWLGGGGVKKQALMSTAVSAAVGPFMAKGCIWKKHVLRKMSNRLYF